MRNRLFIGLGAVVVGALGACTVTTNNPYPDSTSFCTAKAKAECVVSTLCDIDAAACQSWRAQVCMTDATQATSSGTRMYVAANAQACIDAITQAYGSSDKPNASIPYGSASMTASIAGIEDKCARVFSGKAAANQACTSNYDCVGNNICAPVAPGSKQSVCAPPTAVGAGAFCANPGDQCPADQYCAASMSGAAQCTAAGKLGADCTTIPCSAQDNLRCGPGNTCQARAGANQACTADSDCSSSYPFCDPYGGSAVCAAGLAFARGALDCEGYQPNTGGVDAGGGDSGGGDSGGNDSGGGDSGGDSGGNNDSGGGDAGSD